MGESHAINKFQKAMHLINSQLSTLKFSLVLQSKCVILQKKFMQLCVNLILSSGEVVLNLKVDCILILLTYVHTFQRKSLPQSKKYTRRCLNVKQSSLLSNGTHPICKQEAYIHFKEKTKQQSTCFERKNEKNSIAIECFE